MITFFRTVIKAVVIVSLLLGVVYMAFGVALHIFVAFGSNLAAAWLAFFLIGMVTCMIGLAHENGFSKKVCKLGEAFWEW